MGLIKVAEISIDKLEDRKTVTAILHENGYTVGAREEKKDRDRKAVRLLLEGVCGGRHRQGRTLQSNKRKNEGDSQ